MTPALSIQNLSKRFGGATALDRVALTVAPGEVHGLLGSNGSGKSTLIKVLAGYHAPEPGAELKLYGKTVPLPVEGGKVRDLGLAFVHQHLGLVPSLSVAENLIVGRLATQPAWALNWRQINREAAETFARFGLELAPDVPAATLSPVQQALLAIVRAYEDLQTGTSGHPGVLVLDEPTPFLPKSGVDQLFDLVRRCTARGASVIFVSHDVDEVREITDRATILRDGQLIDTVETARTDHDGFVSRIIGRDLGHYAGAQAPAPMGGPVVSVENLAAPGIGPLSFEVAAGEIVGLTGLIGSGCDDVPGLLYGARPATGRLTLQGRSHNLENMTPQHALQRGIAYLPADRLGEAGIGSLPVADNVALPVYERLRGALGLSESRIAAHASRLGADIGVKPNVPALPLTALSGGNAQKALLAKWLQLKPRLLLLDEPTQGVDVGARQQIWDALDGLAEGGAAIVVGSTDYDQLAALCHRVLIMARGQIAQVLTGAELTKERIAEASFRAMTRIA